VGQPSVALTLLSSPLASIWYENWLLGVTRKLASWVQNFENLRKPKETADYNIFSFFFSFSLINKPSAFI